MEAESVKSILESKAVFSVKWGMLILLTGLILLFMFSITIRYPQLIKAEINFPIDFYNNADSQVVLDISCKLHDRNPVNLSEKNRVSINVKNHQDSVLNNLSGIIISITILKTELSMRIILDAGTDIDKVKKTMYSQKYLNADIIYYNNSFFDAILMNFKLKK